MKSTLSVLAALSAASLLFVLTGCTEASQEAVAENPALSAPVPDGMVRGAVVETMDSGGYTYVAVATDEAPAWFAGPQTAVKVGDVVLVSQGMLMNQFTSKTLNRVFDKLYFVSEIKNLTTPLASSAGAAEPVARQVVVANVADVNVDELEPGQNIAWVYANKDSLANQAVRLRGKVVKYNANILGWNFIHIQDGSGAAADRNNDLIVTSKAPTAIGQTVVLAGTLVLDQDFGAGYSYPVLLEDASITTE